MYEIDKLWITFEELIFYLFDSVMTVMDFIQFTALFSLWVEKL